MNKKEGKNVNIYSDDENLRNQNYSNNLTEDLLQNYQVKEDVEMNELKAWDNVTSSTSDDGIWVSFKQNFFKELWPFTKVF